MFAEVSEDLGSGQQRVGHLEDSCTAARQPDSHVGGLGGCGRIAAHVEDDGRGKRHHHVHEVLLVGQVPAAAGRAADQFLGRGQLTLVGRDHRQIAQRVAVRERIADFLGQRHGRPEGALGVVGVAREVQRSPINTVSDRPAQRRVAEVETDRPPRRIKGRRQGRRT